MSANRAPADFGSTLRAARERRGVSLRQIADATKISVAVLEALERNDVSRLPSGIFGRAFVRSYALEVGLDPQQAIQDFIAAFPQESIVAGHSPSALVEDNDSVESDRKLAGTFLWLVLVSVPVAIAVLYFATAGRHRTDAPLPAPAPRAPRADTSPAVTPAVLAQTSAPPIVPALSTAAADPKTTSGPALAPDRLLVGLTVTRPCWVSATVDGQTTIDRLLQRGTQQTVEVHRELVLTAGDGSAIALTLNGAEARPLGKAGEVVTARINLANFKSYLPVR